MYSNKNFHSPSSSSTLFEREAGNRLIKNEPLNIEVSLNETSSESTTDDNAYVHQYDACLPNTKKMKRFSEIGQMNFFENCSKSRIRKKMSNLTVAKILITYGMSLEPPICLTGFQL